MDVVPGGLFNSEDILHKEILKADIVDDIKYLGVVIRDLNIGHFESRVNKKVHSFIPTVSALGLNYPDFDWSRSLNRNLIYTRETPFDTYYAPQNNEMHTSFTEASVAWMLKELAGQPQDPSVYPDGDDLVGPSGDLCDGDTRTYSFAPHLTPGRVLQWSVSSNLKIVSKTARSITVEGYSSGSEAQITAKFANYTVTKTGILVGGPIPDAETTYLDPICMHRPYTVNIPQVEGAESYDIPDQPGITILRVTSKTFDFKATQPGFFPIFIRVYSDNLL